MAWLAQFSSMSCAVFKIPRDWLFSTLDFADTRLPSLRNAQWLRGLLTTRRLSCRIVVYRKVSHHFPVSFHV